MNIFKIIANLYKARFGTFTDDEFRTLCERYSNVNGRVIHDGKKGVSAVLSVFFSHQTPTLGQLNAVYDSGDVRWLYLRNISPTRQLTAEEEQYLATLMDFGPVYRFPRKLGDVAVSLLFESGNIRRIAEYVRDYALPERFELELIERYEMQKPYANPDSYSRPDYAYALKQYLSSCRQPKCQTKRVQDRLLKVADENMWEGLCASQDMTKNLLENNTIRELIAKRYAKALRALLMHSFIPTQELQRYLYATFPELKWELEISKVRHALRKLEKRTGEFWGVEAPDFDEYKIIDESIIADDQLSFIEKKVQLRIDNGNATPYFCAWATDEYPHLGESAYQCVRRFAEKYLAASKYRTEC